MILPLFFKLTLHFQLLQYGDIYLSVSVFVGPLVDEGLIYKSHILLFMDFLVECEGLFSTTASSSFSLLSFGVNITWFVRISLLVMTGCSISPNLFGISKTRTYCV